MRSNFHDIAEEFLGSGPDTAIVLFLLAAEYGRDAGRWLSADGIAIALTLAMVAVLPCFLPSNWSTLTLGQWLTRRGSVAVLGLVLGSLYHSAVAAEASWMRTAPFALLIVAAAISCYVQFYGLMRLRLAD